MLPKVHSFWGDGPDVSIVASHFLLLKNGTEIAIDLSTAEAEQLVAKLTNVIDINKAFDAQFRGEKE